MKIKFSRYDPPYDSYARWNGVCLEGVWKKVKPSLLNSLIPSGLLNKTNSVFVMASASSQVSAFVANLNRVDMPANAVDQEPYIAVFDHSASTASGGFVHHGNWRGRTSKPDEGFFKAIAASGIQAYYPLEEMPAAASGYIEDLKVDSQNQAFWNAFSLLKETNE